MPAVTSVGKAKLDALYHNVSDSVVSLIRYSKELGMYLGFGSGFVLYVNTTHTVILTSVEVFDEDEEDIFVCFSNGDIQPASVFVSNFSSIYTSLVVDTTESSSSKSVVFGGPVVRGEVVCTVSRALKEIPRPGIYTSSVIHPRCFSVSTHSGKPVNKYDDLFAFSCPLAGPCKALQRGATMETLIGSPVFNLKYELVGIIERSSKNKYDLKFGRLIGSVNEELKVLFGNDDWKEALETQLRNKT